MPARHVRNVSRGVSAPSEPRKWQSMFRSFMQVKLLRSSDIKRDVLVPAHSLISIEGNHYLILHCTRNLMMQIIWELCPSETQLPRAASGWLCKEQAHTFSEVCNCLSSHCTLVSSNLKRSSRVLLDQVCQTFHAVRTCSSMTMHHLLSTVLALHFIALKSPQNATWVAVLLQHP